MSDNKLKHAPLIEAILEIKWALSPIPNVEGAQIDPHYRIMVGRLYDKLAGEDGAYPFHEELPSARMPDEIAGHIVQHRFSSTDKTGQYWPLVQVGPGIMTLNDTKNYDWDDYKKRALDAIKKLYEAYPKPQELKLDSLFLRYINAIEIDYLSNDIFEYIQEKLKINISFPANLFEDTDVTALPQNFLFQTVFNSDNPKGSVTLKLGTGLVENRPALMWEMIVQSNAEGIPSEMPINFENWLNSTHELIDDWFRKLIQGDLERRFQGEGDYLN